MFGNNNVGPGGYDAAEERKKLREALLKGDGAAYDDAVKEQRKRSGALPKDDRKVRTILSGNTKPSPKVKPEYGNKFQVPKAGNTSQVPKTRNTFGGFKAGNSPQAPKAGNTFGVFKAGNSPQAPKAGNTFRVPRTENATQVPKAGNTPQVPQAGGRSNRIGAAIGIWFVIAIAYLIYASTSAGNNQYSSYRTSSSGTADYSESGSQSYADTLVDYGLYKDGHGISSYDYVIADSDKRRLTKEDTDKLTLRGINYAKNELYARHGRKFEANELQLFFGSRNWYYGYMAANVESDRAIHKEFNQYEEYNKNYLRDLEEAYGMYELH